MKVTFDEAMTSEAAARIYLRDKDVSSSEKGELAAKYGEDFVKKAMSVDSTDYQIDDTSYDAAKQAGKDAAAEKAGYNGSGGDTGSAVTSAIGAAGAVVGAVAPGMVGGVVSGAVNKIAGDKVLGGGVTQNKNVGDIATVILASAVAAKYYINKPNKDQHNAAIELVNSILPEGQALLAETQEVMDEAAEEVLELAEEAEEKNEEANKKIQEDKTLFDFQRQQYDALKAKKDSGAQLNPDEEALMNNIVPNMQQLGEDITTTTETTSEEVGELNDTMKEYQDVYDDSAESIAGVEGITDYAEGFDESTRTTMYIEGVAQGVNSVSAGVAAGRLAARNAFGLLTAFVVMGGAAALASGKAAAEQIKWAKDMSDEIDIRREVQEFGIETTDLYDENIDNYADNIDFVEDLELEVPEDMEMPGETAPAASQSMMSMAAEQEQNQNGDQQPQGPNGVQSNSKNNANDDSNKKKEEDKQ